MKIVRVEVVLPDGKLDWVDVYGELLEAVLQGGLIYEIVEVEDEG